MHILGHNLLKMHADRWQHPLKTVGWLLLIGLLAVSGPWACLVRCAALEATQHRHGYHAFVHTATAATHAMQEDGNVAIDHTSERQHDRPLASATVSMQRAIGELTALTIAVMPMLLLLVIVSLLIGRLRLLPMLARSIVLLTPRRPPRLSMNIA